MRVFCFICNSPFFSFLNLQAIILKTNVNIIQHQPNHFNVYMFKKNIKLKCITFRPTFLKDFSIKFSILNIFVNLRFNIIYLTPFLYSYQFYKKYSLE